MARFPTPSYTDATTLNSSSWTLVLTGSESNPLCGYRVKYTGDQPLELDLDADDSVDSYIPAGPWAEAIDLGANGTNQVHTIRARRKSSTPGSGVLIVEGVI